MKKSIAVWILAAGFIVCVSLATAHAQEERQQTEPRRLVELRAKYERDRVTALKPLLTQYKKDLEQLQRSLAQARDSNGVLAVKAEIETLGEFTETVAEAVTQTVTQKRGLPRTLRELSGAWKIVRVSPTGEPGDKGFAYFFINNGREPWEEWTFDSKQKWWRVKFQRDGWANETLVFTNMVGNALSGKYYPEGADVLMVPLAPAMIDLPKSLNAFDGFWGFTGIGWSEVAIEFRNGKTPDGRYSLRLNETKKTLDLYERGIKDPPVQFLPVETDVWMGMSKSPIPKTIRRK